MDSTLMKMGKRDLVTLGAMAMAARLFSNRSDQEFRFATAVRDAHFIITGHTHLWDAYQELAEKDAKRMARLLFHRPGRLAILAAFSGAVDTLLNPEKAPEGFARLDEEHFIVTQERRGTLEPLVDEIIGLLDSQWEEAEERRTRPIASDGHFHVRTHIPDPTSPGNRVIQAHYVLDNDAPSEDLPDLGQPADLNELTVPVDELREIATKVDAAFSQSYRGQSLDRLTKHLHTADGRPLTSSLVLNAGMIQVFSACTGSGKSVLARLLALRNVQQGLVTTLVVPRNDTVLDVTLTLREELKVLGHGDALVVPLLSPNSMQKTAEKLARNHTEAERFDSADNAFQEFAYGCPLQAKSTNAQDVDLWQPGEEPCTRLDGIDEESGEPRQYRCPWHGHCGKHRLQKDLASAGIIVTNHINLMSGRMHIPVLANGVVRNSMTVEEAVLHRSHVVLIDEVDAFQATGFSKSAHHVTLARYDSRRPSALQELSDQFSARSGQLPYDLERHIHPKIAQARFLAESYVSNAAHGRIAQYGPNDRKRKQSSRRRLILAQRWDSWCTRLLWRIPKESEEAPTREQIDTFQALFNPRDEADITTWRTVPAIPGVSDSQNQLVRLRNVLLETSNLRNGEDPIYAGAHDHIADVVDPLLETTVTPQDRHLLVDLLVRRAYLEQIRAQIEYMTRSGAPLKASGITAANELVEMLDDNKQWRATPYGPLGAPVFGFTASHDDEEKHRSELALTSFTNDPHASTAHLGDVTALALTGRRRIVLGMSATAYMPGGTMHHLIVKPTWYVPDDITGTLSLRPIALKDDSNVPIRISGNSDVRRDRAHQDMGRALWGQHVNPHLQKLARRPNTQHRARILVACTSYIGAAQLAEGMVSAGADPEMIAVAVKADAEDLTTLPAHYRRRPKWNEISSDALERFPHHPKAKVLIAPLAIAERGLNMVDTSGRSLVGQVVLAVRPIPLMDEPAQLLALIASHAYTTARPTEDPASMLRSLARTSTGVYEELFRTHHFFQALPGRVRLSIVAEMLIGMIQLGGRVRRGGDNGVLYLADYAFHDPSSGSDLPRLIRDLRDQWHNNEQLQLLENLYGSTLRAIFAFADQGELH
ncbi:hypothetical protein [Nocardiopsis sp. FR26]|uniref:hypothetical protein n=1 Tax=Nocardiopsis sp. FR26 TaxID=2605987 RepID=UPI0019160C6D|nr:hypothetical protein [Nocardiopsis sp. FR26]